MAARGFPGPKPRQRVARAAMSVSGRAKSVASFAAKAARQIDGSPVFTDPLREITDQIGVRVITYLQPDVAAVAGLLAEQATVLDDRDMGRETASEGRFSPSLSEQRSLEMRSGSIGTTRSGK